jgi:hypothetical protein
MRRYIIRASALFVGVASVASCSGSDSRPTTTVTSTVTATVTAIPTATSPDSTSTDVETSPANTQQTSTEMAPDAPSGPPILSGIASAPRKLVLSDIFQHVGWEEGSVAVPKRSGTVQGMWTDPGCHPRGLELRFADQKGALRIDVAQALNSSTSSAVLEFQLLADGRLVDTALVKFNAQGRLETPLTGISSVELQVRPSNSECGATAVVTDMSIIPGPA